MWKWLHESRTKSTVAANSGVMPNRPGAIVSASHPTKQRTPVGTSRRSSRSLAIWPAPWPAYQALGVRLSLTHTWSAKPMVRTPISSARARIAAGLCPSFSGQHADRYVCMCRSCFSSKRVLRGPRPVTDGAGAGGVQGIAHQGAQAWLVGGETGPMNRWRRFRQTRLPRP